MDTELEDIPESLVTSCLIQGVIFFLASVSSSAKWRNHTGPARIPVAVSTCSGASLPAFGFQLQHHLLCGFGQINATSEPQISSYKILPL